MQSLNEYTVSLKTLAKHFHAEFDEGWFGIGLQAKNWALCIYEDPTRGLVIAMSYDMKRARWGTFAESVPTSDKLQDWIKLNMKRFKK